MIHDFIGYFAVVGPDPSLAGSLHRPLDSHHISQAQEKLKSAFFLGSHLPKVNFFNRFLSPTGLNLSYLYSRLAFVQGRHMLEGRIAVNDSSHTPTTTASEPFTATSLLSKPAMNIEPDCCLFQVHTNNERCLALFLGLHDRELLGSYLRGGDR